MVKLYVFYVFTMHTKLCSSKKLFDIQSIKSSFMYNFKIQDLEI